MPGSFSVTTTSKPDERGANARGHDRPTRHRRRRTARACAGRRTRCRRSASRRRPPSDRTRRRTGRDRRSRSRSSTSTWWVPSPPLHAASTRSQRHTRPQSRTSDSIHRARPRRRGTRPHGPRLAPGCSSSHARPIRPRRPTRSRSTSTATLATDATYWDLPFPSDLRLAADGTVDLTGFPNRRNLPVVNDLLAGAKRRAGFPVMPIAYVQFTDAAPSTRSPTITRRRADPRHRCRVARARHAYPVVAQTLADDDYTGKNLVALAPRPGIVLRANTRYAFVIDKAFAPGTDVPEQFAALAAGTSDDANRRPRCTRRCGALDESTSTTALVATVFTTGDEVAVLRAALRGGARRASRRRSTTSRRSDRRRHARRLLRARSATVTLPQFQTRHAAVRSRRPVRRRRRRRADRSRAR